MELLASNLSWRHKHADAWHHGWTNPSALCQLCLASRCLLLSLKSCRELPIQWKAGHNTQLSSKWCFFSSGKLELIYTSLHQWFKKKEKEKRNHKLAGAVVDWNSAYTLYHQQTDLSWHLIIYQKSVHPNINSSQQQDYYLFKVEKCN